MPNLKAKIDMLIAQIQDIETEYNLNDEITGAEFEKYVMELDELAREYRSAVGRRMENDSYR